MLINDKKLQATGRRMQNCLIFTFAHCCNIYVYPSAYELSGCISIPERLETTFFFSTHAFERRLSAYERLTITCRNSDGCSESIRGVETYSENPKKLLYVERTKVSWQSWAGNIPGVELKAPLRHFSGF